MEETISTNQNHNAKFAFFYLLSLVALGFLAVAVGNVLFQIINKNIADISEFTGYSSEALRFSIAAIIVAAPIYYLSIFQINKNLFSGVLSKDSGVRKWLTYLVLLISSVTIIGDLINVIFNYLGGELTLKALLKGLTILIIAGVIFTYYLYDIKREKTQGERDSAIKLFGYGSLAAVVIVFIASFFFVESPAVARSMRLDAEVVEKMSQIENAVQMYYDTEGGLPESLSALIDSNNFIQADTLQNHVTKKEFEYNIIEDKKYELCTEFLRSNLNDDYGPYGYIDNRGLHDAGHDCFTRTVNDYNSMEKPAPVERF